MEENRTEESVIAEETVLEEKDENVSKEEKNEITVTENENVTEENGEISEEISSESFAKTLANPMFAVFAKGRSGSVEETVRDFEKMLAAGKNSLSEEDLMKMTPGAGFSAACGVALSERQRKIARDAGMSYREYYEIIRAIPTKTK